MMTGWLLYDRKQYDINKWFADELLKYCSSFCEIRLIIIENLRYGVCGGTPLYYYEEEPVAQPDFAIVRTIYPVLSYFLEFNGVRLYNRADISRICNDKRLTYLAATKSGLPILPTQFLDKRFLSPRQIDSVRYPCVVKSASGHGGKEVALIEDREELLSFIGSISSDDFLIQQVCATVGRDLRVYVLGDKIMGAVLRSSENFKSNYSLGGTATPYALNDAETDSVFSILGCLPCKADFIGIDFLLDGQRLVFNEIEDVVGSRMLYVSSDLNVARILAEYIRKTV